MTTTRKALLDWAEQGRISPWKLYSALSIAGALPNSSDWRRFIEQLLLWLGTIMVAAGVIFFFAYNWENLDRFFKFGLAEALVIASLFVIWRLGLDSMPGKAVLLAASLFVGGLLALVGQTYQTGADTFELFATWAVLILPWVLAGRFCSLWVLWLTLVNVSLVLYYNMAGGLFWALFGPEGMLWVLFGLNTVALVIWELLAAKGVVWLRERWAIRLLATASGGFITALAFYVVADWSRSSPWGLPIWVLWISGAYLVYRRLTVDVYVLAGGVLSVVLVVFALLAKMFDLAGDSSILPGLVVIVLSAAGGLWLKQVVSETKS